MASLTSRFTILLCGRNGQATLTRQDYGNGFVGVDSWAVGKEDENLTTSQRVGLNVVHGVGSGVEQFIEPNDHADDELTALSYAGNTDELRYQIGDSGGPAFVSINGIYALFAINCLIYGKGSVFPSLHDPALPGLACILASAFIDKINGAMLSAFEGSTEQITVVPEARIAFGEAPRLQRFQDFPANS